MADEVLSHDLHQIDSNSAWLPDNMKYFSEKCSERGIDTIYFSEKKIISKPLVAMRIDSNSREMICKLLAMQIIKKDKTFLFSVSPDGKHIYLSMSDERMGQNQQFIEELIADMDKVDEAIIDENIMKNVEALIKFAENEDFIPFNSKNGDHYGYFYEIDSNSKIVTFHNPRLYEDNNRNLNGITRKTISIPFDRLAEEYKKKSLIYGTPKDTSLMTDEEYEKAAEVWSEGNPELKKTLMLARRLHIQTSGCCAGHNFEYFSPQICFIANSKESIEILTKLLAHKVQKKGKNKVLLFSDSKQSFMVSILSKQYGYDEEFFKELNEEIESIVQGKENPDTTTMDKIIEWLKIDSNSQKELVFDSERQSFSNWDKRSPVYPISVLEEMLDESHSLDEFDERMISLFDVRTISGQEMKQTAEKTINEGLSFSSFKRFCIELMQKIGLMSKDEHNGNERQ